MSGTVAADARDNNADINQTPKLTKTDKNEIDMQLSAIMSKWSRYRVISTMISAKSLM